MKFFKKTSQVKTERHPNLLGLVVGDTVKVCSDENKVKMYQAEVGGYSTQLMKGVLGKTVRIKHISDYGVKVSWEGRDFDLHPENIEISGPATRIAIPSNVHSGGIFKAIADNDAMKFLEEIKINMLNITNSEGRTPINAACVIGNFTIVELLLDFQSDLNIWDKDGNLPVHNCVLMNHFEILKFILQANEDQLNKTTQGGKSLLHIAVIENRLDIVKYLIEKNIDGNIKDLYGRTAYQYTTNMTNPNITRLLEDSNPLSLWEPPFSLSIYNQPFSPISNQRTNNHQNDYYQMYLNSSLIEPPRDDEGYPTIPSGYPTILSDYPTIPPDYPTIPPISGNNFRPSLDSSIAMTFYGRNDTSRQNKIDNCNHNANKVVFLECNHTCCSVCAITMTHCHKCQTKIINKMTIYL